MAEWVDKDKGWLAFVKSVFDQHFVEVTVGIHGDSEPYLRGQNEPASVPQIASFHEFGTVDVPERSFLRSTVDEKADEWTQLMTRVEKLVASKRMDVARALNVLGLRMVADVQKKIQNGPFAPLADKTVKAKGSSRPLIDTGRMRQSVTYRVLGVSSKGKLAAGLWAYRHKGGTVKIGK